jgi:hypothetical protein
MLLLALFLLPLTILSFIIATEKKNKVSIEFTDLKKFMKKIFLMNDVSWFLPENVKDCDKMPAPEFNLFLFCILTNRIESAILFWRIGRVLKINGLGF